jgi:hypothetical protein
MYIGLMVTNWGIEHLQQCGWYLDCPKNKMPTSEITLQECIELGFPKLVPSPMEQITKKKPTIANNMVQWLL